MSEQDLANYNGGGYTFEAYRGEFPPPSYYSQALSPQALHARMTAWAYGVRP
ncbi:hypothetical protein VYH81_01080 [Streptococcus anginosus]|uniref:hypothetical protein n=1 Tax=Streptococcus anginosus TaxID=1328 RepID=UPI00142FE9E4|nr:hypothetical protein [Streptococcus anginosus]MCW0970770.1 hypothetical protein [Streptococcus anginosus]MCW0992617.1 hypothetical protein [Streptococcus anginosus]MCW1000731.1 hypothetical protein [Streptococcus anginosus]MCW1033996.1 hypothetical protein [Streptococcus anginosus]MCW1057532.1 hypothetical protein [Streptococcus anginosus]